MNNVRSEITGGIQILLVGCGVPESIRLEIRDSAILCAMQLFDKELTVSIESLSFPEFLEFSKFDENKDGDHHINERSPNSVAIVDGSMLLSLKESPTKLQRNLDQRFDSDVLRKIMAIVPTVLIYQAEALELARVGLELGAVDTLSVEELKSPKVVAFTAIHAIRRKVLERQLDSLRREARRVNQIEQEVYARLALLPATGVKELLGLLCSVLEEQHVIPKGGASEESGRQVLRVMQRSIYKLLPASETQDKVEGFGSSSFEPMISLLQSSLASRGVAFSVSREYGANISEATLTEAQRAECVEFLMHAAIIALFSAKPGAHISAALTVHQSEIKLEIIGPKALVGYTLGESNGAGDSFLAELIGGVLKTTFDDEHVRFTLRRASDKTSEKITILVVDDNQINTLILQRLLAKEGHNVAVYNSAEAVLDDVKKRSEASQRTLYDLALLDIHMPGMDGVELALELRKRVRADLPVYAVSADHSSENLRRCKEAKFNGFIGKPFQLQQIRNILREHTSDDSLRSINKPTPTSPRR